MSHESKVSALRQLTRKSRSTSPGDFIQSLSKESDRGAIILAATLVDDLMEEAIRARLSTRLNSDELKALFDYSGLAGSFSARTRFAQALGLIPRALRRTIDTIREMRNACAHARCHLDFGTVEIRALALALLTPESESIDSLELRHRFTVVCAVIAEAVIGTLTLDPQDDNFVQATADTHVIGLTTSHVANSSET